ncbi:tRNA (adenosine(37)-N6)-threonylcarbamoyltransferase complex dimerization subunit type 1 TsaB [Ornithinibacillus bavariensis]|uniref:tRNA (adenosine(37)-N6)-threonylcarbamoyltransferase complex dimerization subunit type 1 TsaB n=1 Tax=Ornithinibacillus bavariensis TaxID=545502 RepID=UPI000EC3D1E9|nr:tRNA (adenosine(37)-N6)-threonylcarbamoyltransferase complex dimerization subunit type 1 TsaB [Ornithinibacillus sp.]
MYTLTIDTSTQSLGVAILKDNEVLGEIITNIAKNHSVRLMPAIDYLLQEVGLEPKQLSKIVVAKGPGSYTGVRIGLTTAKTLAWSLKIPVVGVSSLEGLAYRGLLTNSLICPFFDARRGLIYTGLYKVNGDSLVLVEKEQNVLIEDWLKQLEKMERNILFISPDIQKHRQLIKERLSSYAEIPEMPYHIMNPSDLALAAIDKVEDQVHTLTPNYLRLAEAEAKWIKAQEDKANG